jgi:hypothetical protein
MRRGSAGRGIVRVGERLAGRRRVSFIRNARTVASAICMVILSSCATSHRQGAQLAFVPGRLSDDPGQPCLLSTWRDPWGRTSDVCLDRSAAIRPGRADIYGFRIHDREVDGQTWYLVSAYLTGEFQDQIWKVVRAHVPRPYAVLVDEEIMFVSPEGLLLSPSLIAAVQHLSEAEALAYSWGAPVDRYISAELDAKPTCAVSLAQLLVDPTSLMGSKVLVQGYLSHNLELFLSREHAEAYDYMSAIRVIDPSDEGVVTRSHCAGQWVTVEAVLDSTDGMPILTRLERMWPASTREPHCWPVETPAAP